jgi:membrane protein DedA with SNARE-associated domain
MAALVSVPALVYLAWGFGEHIDHVVSWVRRSEYGILFVFLLAVVWIAVKMMRKRRPKKA